MKKTYSVYKITNKINGKMYIGCTSQGIKKRFKEHLYSHKKNRNNQYLYRAFRKYGPENFKISLLIEAETYEKMLSAEIKYIKKYDTYHNGYNMTLGGEGTVGNRNSGEKLKKTFTILSPEGKYVTHRGMSDFARKHNLSRECISCLLRGKIESHKGWRLKPKPKNWVHHNTGRIRSKAARRNMSKAHKGIPLSKKHSRASGKANRRTFTILSPKNVLHTYTGVNAFCGIHKLHPTSVCWVLDGKRKDYKGWRLP